MVVAVVVVVVVGKRFWPKHSHFWPTGLENGVGAQE